MSRPHILASMGNGAKVLIRMGKEGGAVEVYRFHGSWEGDGPRLDGQTQVGFDAATNVVTLTRPWGVERGVKMDPRDAKRLLAKCPPPWVEQEEAWDEGDALDEKVRAEHRANGTGVSLKERQMRVSKACGGGS